MFVVLTVYGEVRGENFASKKAIAWVIRNRLLKKTFGDSYRSIVLKPLQFSCWRKNDPNYKLLQNPGKNGGSAYEKEKDKRVWQDCKEAYKEVFNTPETDSPIPQICHYFSGQPSHRWEARYFDLPDVPHFHFVKLDK